MRNLITFLWFDKQAEQAVEFYTSVFKDTKVHCINRHPAGAPGKTGRVMTVCFRLRGQEFIALNGGPRFKFTEAVSFVVHGRTQQEIDYYWRKLSAGGKQQRCGWLKDRYGLSWQIVPSNLGELLQRAGAMQAMRKMRKIDIARLKKAG